MKISGMSLSQPSFKGRVHLDDGSCKPRVIDTEKDKLEINGYSDSSCIDIFNKTTNEKYHVNYSWANFSSAFSLAKGTDNDVFLKPGY